MIASRWAARSRTSALSAATSYRLGLGDAGHRQGDRGHGSSSSFRERSRAGAECVSAPTGDEILAGRRHVPGRLEGHATARLERRAPGDPRDSGAQLAEAHVVEQEARRTRAERRVDLVLVAAFDLERHAGMGLERGTGRLRDPSGHVDVVILQEHLVPEADPVVHAATGAHRRLLEQAQARRGLARVEHARSRALDGAGEPRGLGRDAAEALDEVQRGCAPPRGRRARRPPGAERRAAGRLRPSRRLPARGARARPRGRGCRTRGRRRPGRTAHRAPSAASSRGRACPRARSPGW